MRSVDTHDLTLRIATGDALDIRRLRIAEALDEPFLVSIVARSPSRSISLSDNIGRPASLRVDLSRSAGPVARLRTWSGVCAEMSLLRAESGLSTYRLLIAPRLWLLAHRRRFRSFQQKTLPQIALAVLAEWGIEPRVALSASYLRADYVVQYDETDLAFLTRLLERAGIAFHFDTAGDDATLVLTDRPQAADARPSIPFVAEPGAVGLAGDDLTGQEFVTRVRVAERVRPGAFTLRDFDFRRRPDFPLFGEAEADRDARLEHYRWEKGSSRFIDPSDGSPETTPVADDRGRVRCSPNEERDLAERRLQAERVPHKTVTFATNCLDLEPGRVTTILGHPRAALTGERLLLHTVSIEGVVTGEWSCHVEAVFASEPYRPARDTPRPRVLGVESAIVTGEGVIHTDEYGRVRVRFPWDRESDSCWMRVGQPWAGSGYGMLLLPRVGHEVLVGFQDGDPDCPMVVGRVYNGTHPVPHALPRHKTRSTWKTDSLGQGGYNELLFEDKAGEQIVYVQAERDLQRLAKRQEIERVGEHHSTVVGRHRSAVIQTVDATMVGGVHTVQMIKPPSPEDLGILPQQEPSVRPRRTLMELRDRRIIYTTGQATVAFVGDTVQLEARGTITVKASAGDVIVEGAQVLINSVKPPAAPRPQTPEPPPAGTFKP